ncbi:hypothetical protein OROHE_002794 [Orobanche hederae]
MHSYGAYQALITLKRIYNDMNQKMPLIYVKLYTYEIFGGLAYMHSVAGVCHRDLMPQNILCKKGNRSCFQVAAILSKSPFTALEACAHPFFDELREPDVRLQNGRPLPPPFNLKEEWQIASRTWTKMRQCKQNSGLYHRREPVETILVVTYSTALFKRQVMEYHSA